MTKHLSDDQLTDQLYGLTCDPHVQDCSECSRRLGEFEARRAELAAANPVSVDFMSAQRRSIYSRLGERPGSSSRWAPAGFAAACLLVAGMFVFKPVAAPLSRTDAVDAQLFSDVYSMEESTEPIAAAPIHALFEDNQ